MNTINGEGVWFSDLGNQIMIASLRVQFLAGYVVPLSKTLSFTLFQSTHFCKRVVPVIHHPHHHFYHHLLMLVFLAGMGWTV